MSAPLLYREPGSTWWPLLWGPGFCAAGWGWEALTGPSHPLAWAGAAVLLLGLTVLWVRARRVDRVVELTEETLRQGTEVIAVSRLARVTDVDAPEVCRPLGGGYAIPRKTHPVPLELDDGSTVLGWARFPDDLLEVLAPVVAGRQR
ncbi:hypothetical protein [Actinokineospora bangkokensis]|uniref:DUF3093 domain-containing protein n=1 Tax=Actinokineospora bangkokensis TaxID=1193682 RepID=A0A1Q9LFB8_9PSEU|nr:hypothetical protein [Actinokineospora bangkokensis]OLR90737.1 hypothetical protein BJP25_29540 [Actinokineospora bangkokensis]